MPAFFTSKFKKKLFDVIKLSTGGMLTFCGICFYSNNEEFFKKVLMPMVHLLDPEVSHRVAIMAASVGIVPHPKLPQINSLENEVFGMKFSNPVGLAAGFDKNGEAVNGLSHFGFGFIEVGSVTPQPQEGNPKPRLFRLHALKSVINRYGFVSDGQKEVYTRLSELPPPSQRKVLLGVNLGKNKWTTDPVNDYIKGIQLFGPISNYLVINISSPNTPGLRDLQMKDELENLLTRCICARDALQCIPKPAVLLKISPDLTLQHKRDIALVISKSECRIDGLIVSNTTTSRPQLGESCVDSQLQADLHQKGGLSGEALRELSLSCLKDMARLTKGSIPLIGVGGVSNGNEAMQYIEAGASLVQVLTALVFDGPPVVQRINTELQSIMREKGYKNIQEAIVRHHN